MKRETTRNKSWKNNPWSWISTLYFAQGLPYVAVMTISVIMYKRLGMSNTDIALYTGWLGLPWVIKPFWSPFVDIIKTKRWWILIMQWVIAIALAGVAFTIPTPFYVQLSFAIFMLMGFASATHDIAADGFYMLGLTEHEQSFYVGIRSTFYRIATVVGQGLLVILAGSIEMSSGLEPAKITVKADPTIAPITASIPALEIDSDNSSSTLGFEVAIADLFSVQMADSISYEGQMIPSSNYVQMLRSKVTEENVKNGFITAEEIQSKAAKKEWSSFRLWLKKTFGEKEKVSTTVSNNLAVAAVQLNQKPSDDKDIVLIVSFEKGDKSIALSKDSRFVFNSGNWDKPAYICFDIDGKMKEPAEATFRGTSGNIPLAWSIVFVVLSVFFFLVVLYHTWVLPKPVQDTASTKNTSAKMIFKEFLNAFKTFFTKFPVWQTVAAIFFMLLYRFPEAQLTKIIQPFLLDPIDKGGMGLPTGKVGLVYGTVGIIGLTLGGIIGGMVAAKGGLKKWMQPMAWSMSLTCLTFVYLSYHQEVSFFIINLCVFIEQFGYGFGYTAYMLFLIYFSEGKFKTSHYAICTGFMALSMMTGMIAGWIQETVGYQHFFIWTMICCILTILVALLVKVNPQFGLKKETKE